MRQRQPLPQCAPGVVPVQRLVLGRGQCAVRRPLPRYQSARQLVRLLRDHLRGLPQESFLVVLLDLEARVVGVAEVALGGIEDVYVDARLILGAVLSAGVADFALVHNHPRSTARPSEDDDALVKAIAEMADVMGLHLVDSVVVAGRRGDWPGAKSEFSGDTCDRRPQAQGTGATLG